MSVTLTDKAITKIKEFYAQDKTLEGKQLRVFVEKGGCSGYSYAFKFDEAVDTDTKLPYEGFSVVIDSETEKLVKGAMIDYKEDFGQEGFAIQNPNAKKSCGCGNSFEV